jgi:YYY domain-containing protein
MPASDIALVFQWWSALFLVGVVAFPLTKKLFYSWYDRGYFFSKAVGMAVVTYIVFLLGTLRVLPFTVFTIAGAMFVLFVLGIAIFNKTYRTDRIKRSLHFFSFVRGRLTKLIFIILAEEVVFFGALLLWSWVKAHEPSIQGLEKFMDFGFMQSLLNSQYFPAPDMWWAGGSINYYFFGHLVTAVLTRLSGLDLSVTFNLMLAAIFALTATMSFSIGYQLFRSTKHEARNPKQNQNFNSQKSKRFGFHFSYLRSFVSNFDIRISDLFCGLLTAFLVTLAGNMQTIYVFTKGYLGDNVVPFWTILWNRAEFLSNVGEGMMRYWYANATRFIPFTIHEFPSYSFVVSDVHGHVLSIPFALLAIALLIKLFTSEYTADPQETKRLTCLPARQGDKEIKIFGFLNLPISLSPYLIFLGFLLGVLLMTNALDGPIYGLLFVVILLTISKFEARSTKSETKSKWKQAGLVGIVMVIAGLTALPFLWHFKPFSAGIGVNCPLGFLADTKIGPFIFEGVDKCQKSPLWMMELLWGFFWFTGIWLFVKRMWGKDQYDGPINRILKVFYIYGIVLIIIPEFFYVKDIYPAHFRSNTMFKLGYQAFIMWSIISAYVIVHFIFQRFSSQISNFKYQISNKSASWRIKFQISNFNKKLRILFFILLLPQLFLVSIYPLFSVRSYFGELKTYRSIYGLEWLEKEYPDDWKVIEWLKGKIQEKQGSPTSPRLRGATMTGLPVIVEADGESYTDYNHISAFAGAPTIVGWGVHEWLWRGSYNAVAPRREEVKMIYEAPDMDEVHKILDKYNVRYIIVGKLEREKYKVLQEARLATLGTVAFRSGDTVVYDVGKQNE